MWVRSRGGAPTADGVHTTKPCRERLWFPWEQRRALGVPVLPVWSSLRHGERTAWVLTGECVCSDPNKVVQTLAKSAFYSFLV